MLVLLKVSSIFQYLKRALPCTRSCLVVFAYITPLFTAASELRSTPVSENQCALIRRHETKLRLLNCVHKEIVNTYSERTASSTAHHNIISTNLNAESITCLFVVLWKPWFLKNLKKKFFFSPLQELEYWLQYWSLTNLGYCSFLHRSGPLKYGTQNKLEEKSSLLGHHTNPDLPVFPLLFFLLSSCYFIVPETETFLSASFPILPVRRSL